MNKSQRIPRGICNNNPLNIRIGHNWWGEDYNQTDTQFEQFEKMEYGIRAAFIILRRYIEKYKRNTIELIISSWELSSENNTKAYISTVAKKMGIDPTLELHYDDRRRMIDLASAMIEVECGCPVAREVIALAYDIAHR